MSVLRVVIGAAAGYAVLLAAMLLLERERSGMGAVWNVGSVLALVAAPAIGAWLGTEVVQWVSPRRVLDGRAARRVGQVVHGGAGAVVGAVVIAAMVPVVDLAVPDAVVTGVGGLAGAVVVALVRRRVRAGVCVGCGYSLEGLGRAMGEARCPECGRVVDAEELGIGWDGGSPKG